MLSDVSLQEIVYPLSVPVSSPSLPSCANCNINCFICYRDGSFVLRISRKPVRNGNLYHTVAFEECF